MASFTMSENLLTQTFDDADLPPHPDDLNPTIDGLYRPQLLALLRCSRYTLMADHRALRSLNKVGLIKFNYPERAPKGFFARRQVELLLLMRRSTVTKSAHHAIDDVIEYANKHKN